MLVCETIDFFSAQAENKSIISFDPNVKLPLWDSEESCRDAILEFLYLAHIVKISDEELEFITGYDTVDKAKEVLFNGNVKLVLFTLRCSREQTRKSCRKLMSPLSWTKTAR